MNRVFGSSEGMVYLLLGLVLFFLVTKEAYTIPLTHDEGNTIYCSTTSIWDIVTYKDPVPNNHILNTLLIKVNTTLFGEGLFTDRLHNYLAFIPFFLFTVLIANRLFKELWLRLALVSMICLQPFLLDFFSVTRGYGLSVALQMISIYYFVRRLEGGKTSDLVMTMFWAALGVYANFTLLNFFIPLSALLICESAKRWFYAQKRLFFKETSMVLIINILLGIIIFLPLYKMVSTKQFVFWGTTGFFHDTVRHLILSMRSGVDYFEITSEKIYFWVIGFVISLMITGLISLIWVKDKKMSIWFFSLLAMVVLYNIGQFYFFQIPYLNARTALFFIPLVSLVLVFSLQNILDKNRFIGLLLSFTIIILCSQHFIKGFKVKSTFEWYYDDNTYQVLDDLKEIAHNEHHINPAHFNCYWIFYPSIDYHLAKSYQGVVQMAAYNTKIEDDQNALFYYAQGDEVEKLKDRFQVIKTYSGGRVLMRAIGR